MGHVSHHSRPDCWIVPIECLSKHHGLYQQTLLYDFFITWLLSIIILPVPIYRIIELDFFCNVS
jgi:hypothetical protein